jgi:hypothetical protein
VNEIAELPTGREMSAVCLVRDYVEFHFDGPILRALTDPRGRFGEWGWRFPERDAPAAMRLYIGKSVTSVNIDEGISLFVEFGAEHIMIPLDEDSRRGPEALHVVGVDQSGVTDVSRLWVL